MSGAGPVDSQLAARFLGRIGTAAVDHDRVAARLDELVREGRTAWPDLAVDAGVFVDHVAERFDASLRVETFLDQIRGADLWLACACVRGVDGAMQTFEKACLARIDAFVRRVDGAPAFLDEVRAALRERLLMPREDGTPRLAAYAGRGSLVNWVGVAGQRVALSLRQGVKQHDTLDTQVERELAADSDPEVQYLKARYEQDFHAALREAMASLDDRERALLRLYYANGLSLDKIAAVYRVNPSTVSRWLSAARDRIVERMREHLRAKLQLSPTEFDSLARLVRSNLETSLFRLLGEQASHA